MGYISNKGVLAGPIQLNGNKSSDNNKIWIQTASDKFAKLKWLPEDWTLWGTCDGDTSDYEYEIQGYFDIEKPSGADKKTIAIVARGDHINFQDDNNYTDYEIYVKEDSIPEGYIITDCHAFLCIKNTRDVSVFVTKHNDYKGAQNSYSCIYAATPSYTEESWIMHKNAVATMGWVAENFSSTGGVPSFNPSEYVNKTEFISLKSIVDNNVIRIQALEDKILDIDPLKTRVTTLENNFNSYKNNPYPDGVIFVAGTAAEVV